MSGVKCEEHARWRSKYSCSDSGRSSTRPVALVSFKIVLKINQMKASETAFTNDINSRENNYRANTKRSNEEHAAQIKAMNA